MCTNNYKMRENASSAIIRGKKKPIKPLEHRDRETKQIDASTYLLGEKC